MIRSMRCFRWLSLQRQLRIITGLMEGSERRKVRTLDHSTLLNHSIGKCENNAIPPMMIRSCLGRFRKSVPRYETKLGSQKMTGAICTSGERLRLPFGPVPIFLALFKESRPFTIFSRYLTFRVPRGSFRDLAILPDLRGDQGRF